MKGLLCKNLNHPLRSRLLTVLFAGLCSLLGSFGLSTSSASALEVVNVLPKYDSSINGGSLSWMYTQHPLGSVTWQYPSVRIGNPFINDTINGNSDPFNRLTQMTYNADKVYSIRKGSKATLSFVATTFSSGINGSDMPAQLDSSWTCPSGKGAIAVTSCDIKASTSVSSEPYYFNITPSSSDYQKITAGITYSQTSTMTLEITLVEDFNSDKLEFAGQFFYWYRAMWPYGRVSPTIVTFLTMPAFSFVYEESVQDAVDRNGQQQLEAINNQTKQDKDQYDQEKQEESDRENSGKEEADKAGGIFNFGVLNPFAPLFELFKPSGCASIPIIAGWLHAESSTYCSWFPSSVRSVLTPVFGIASMMLLFGFVMTWLGGTRLIHLSGGD